MLSALLKSGKLFPILPSTIWYRLIGELITCPICGKKAVIIPCGIVLPISETHHTPCHCCINISHGYIAFHWCTTSRYNTKNQWWAPYSTTDCYPHSSERWDNGIDVCKSFGKLIKDSHKI